MADDKIEWGAPEFPNAPVDTAEDVKKSVAAKGTIGAVTSLSPGVLGAIGSGLQEGALWLMGKAGGPEFEANVRRGILEGLSPEQRQAVEEGRAISTGGDTIPTMKGVEEATKEVLPFTSYTPQTAAGRYSGSAAELAGGMATGALLGPGSVGRKAVNVGKEALTGAVAGVGSELGADWAKAADAPEYEGWARLAGAILSPSMLKKAGSTAKEVYQTGQKISGSAAYIDDTTAKLLAEDLRNGSSPMTLQQVQDEIVNGGMPNLFDMAGKKTRKYLRDTYNLSDETQDAMAELNQKIRERGAEGASNLRSHIEGTTPGIDSMSQEALSAENAKRQTQAAYDLAKKNPAAASITTKEMEDLVKTDGHVRDAMADVDRAIAGQRANEFSADPHNLDLAYWDMVAKRLGDRIKKSDPNAFGSTSQDTIDYVNATAAKKKLQAILDKEVPEYADARGAHIEAIGVKDAPEAGSQFWKLKTTKDYDEFMDVFNKSNPQQKELFQRGFVRSIYDDLGSGKKIDGVLSRLTSPAGQKYYPQIMGSDAYETLVGRATAETIRSKMKAVEENSMVQKAITGGKELLNIAVGGGKAGAVGTAIGGPGMGAVTGGAMALFDAAKDRIKFNYAEAKVAPEVVRLLQSTDPDDIQRLGALISKNKDAQNVADKYTSFFAQYPATIGLTQKQADKSKDERMKSEWGVPIFPDQIPTGQAAGGRIARKAGGKVTGNSISREVERTRKELSNRTAQMLSMPDDAIVTALKIAKH